MTKNEALKQLEAAGTAQNRKIYRRHGAGDNIFGISFANLRVLAKAIKVDHALALDLWSTGNDDARSLALLIADPARLDRRQLDRWAADLNGFLSYTFTQLVSRTPLVQRKIKDWLDARSEWTSCVGWLLLGHFAMNDREQPDAWFEAHLRTIEHEIHQRRNWVRNAMNSALIGIGVRNAALEKRALAVAKSIGKVTVDHGETSCKTPDAAAYIRKTKAHRRRKK
jgi:3-methyladenine DNA glycosylase AlkD